MPIFKEFLAQNFFVVIINQVIKLSQQICYVRNKIAKSIGIIYKCRPFINHASYNTFVLPYLIYCIEISSKYGTLLRKPILIPYIQT